jgi:hypothetical protein
MKFKLAIILSILVLILSISPVLSAVADWQQYGNSYSPLLQAQNSTFIGKFITSSANQTAILNLTTSVATNYINSNFSYQPLVSSLGSSTQQYIIIQDTGIIRILNSSLSEVSSTLTNGDALSQIAILDFDSDGKVNDIANFYKTSSTIYTFKVFKFDASTQTFTGQIYEKNYTINAGTQVSGIRCDASNCYSTFFYNDGTFIYLNFTSISSSTNSQVQLNPKPSSTISDNKIFEPVAFGDFNNDGNREYFIYSMDKLITFQSSGTIISEISYTGGTFIGYFSKARMFKPDSSGIWKIAVITESIGVTTGCSNSRVSLYSVNFNRSFNWVQDGIGCGSGGNLALSDGLAIADYNLDGFDDIFTSVSYNPYGTTYRVHKGTDGSLLAGSPLSPLLEINFPKSFIVAKMDNDSYSDIIAFGYKYLTIYSMKKDTMLLNLTANRPAPSSQSWQGCIPADINSDGFNELICSGSGGTTIFYSGLNYSSPLPPICNHNGTCDAGETYNNCPDDCSFVAPNITQATDTGGMPLPTKIVDINNVEQGLLPEIYYGTLGFLSNTLMPIMIIIFVIIFVLIITAIGSIIVKIAKKVGS